MHRQLQPLLLFLSFLSSTCSYADDVSSYTPYYSGSLLSFFSENVAPGQLEIQPYLYQTTQPGNYDQNWSFQKSKTIHELSLLLLFETGITKQVDFTLNLGSTYNQIGNLHTLLYQDM